MGERVGPQGRYRALNSAHSYSERDVVGCYGWAWRGLAWAPDRKAAGSIPARRTSIRNGLAAIRMRTFCARRFPSGYPQRRGGDPSPGHGSPAARPLHGWAFGARSTDSRVLTCTSPFNSNRRPRRDHVCGRRLGGGLSLALAAQRQSACGFWTYRRAQPHRADNDISNVRPRAIIDRDGRLFEKFDAAKSPVLVLTEWTSLDDAQHSGLGRRGHRQDC